MKLMIDDAVWGYKEIFSSFGEITALPGRLITRESLLDCEILIVRSRTKVNPSPFSAYKGFFGSGHFSKTNSYLTSTNQKAIDWSINP